MPCTRFLPLVATTLLLATSAPASAWSRDAHAIVCEIAWQRFTPAARKLVRDLRRADRAGSRTFAASCFWADTVHRRGGAHPQTKAYHYVNVPTGSAGIDPARDCSGPKRCVTWAIEHYGRQLTDTKLPQRTRAEALKFLAHFIGDVHQPLHVGRREDRGGNTLPVDYFGDFGRCGARKERNLHQVWDRSILERAGFRWPEAARALHRDIDADSARNWADTNFLGWANESFQLCETFVYAIPETVARCHGRRFGLIDQSYNDRALAITRERLQRAGVRLAHILDLAARGELPW